MGLTPGGSASASGCTPLTVSLLDSVSNAPGAAPYPVSVALSETGAVLAYYQDPSCTLPTSSLTIPSGSSSATVYLGGTAQGTASLNASHPDFLSGTASVDVGPAASGAASQLEVGCSSAGGGGWRCWGLIALSLLLRTQRQDARPPSQSRGCSQ